jgi:hypothetical protein
MDNCRHEFDHYYSGFNDPMICKKCGKIVSERDYNIFYKQDRW